MYIIFYPAPTRFPALISPAAKATVTTRRPPVRVASERGHRVLQIPCDKIHARSLIVEFLNLGLRTTYRWASPLRIGKYFWRVQACNAYHRCRQMDQRPQVFCAIVALLREPCLETVSNHFLGLAYSICHVPLPRERPRPRNRMTAFRHGLRSRCPFLKAHIRSCSVFPPLALTMSGRSVIFRSSRAEPFQTLIERWNGTAWTIVPSPNVSERSNELFHIAVIRTSDAWAVGASMTHDSRTFSCSTGTAARGQSFGPD